MVVHTHDELVLENERLRKQVYMQEKRMQEKNAELEPMRLFTRIHDTTCRMPSTVINPNDKLYITVISGMLLFGDYEHRGIYSRITEMDVRECNGNLRETRKKVQQLIERDVFLCGCQLLDEQEGMTWLLSLPDDIIARIVNLEKVHHYPGPTVYCPHCDKWLPAKIRVSKITEQLCPVCNGPVEDDQGNVIATKLTEHNYLAGEEVGEGHPISRDVLLSRLPRE